MNKKEKLTLKMKLNIMPKIDQSWSIVDIAKKAPPDSWKDVFESVLPELEHIHQLLDVKKTFGLYYPLKCDLFNAFVFCHLNDVKVILMGYEPFNKVVQLQNTTLPRDIGMSYCVRYDDRPIPPMLNQLYQDLKVAIHFKIPDHGYLIKWAQQGVLLLNQCLTVSPTKSHAEFELWYGFLNKIFKAISQHNPKTIVVLRGRKVQCVKKLLPDNFVILESMLLPDDDVHYLKQINELLIKQNKTPIDWHI
ncbi:MAG TPA: hypothetical protein VLG50_05480 [Candidatus Saccharimonadales bacterium]|nr:hypothetical protein [Candidatus Saccharimonadales bacterium]